MKTKLMCFVALMVFASISCQKQEEITELSSADVVKIIGDYIKEMISEDGSFVVEDEKENRTWKLEYVKIYEPVQTGEGDYFACVDFAESSDRLDVDLYVTKTEGVPKVSDVVIHMVNGENRK